VKRNENVPTKTRNNTVSNKYRLTGGAERKISSDGDLPYKIRKKGKKGFRSPWRGRRIPVTGSSKNRETGVGSNWGTSVKDATEEGEQVCHKNRQKGEGEGKNSSVGIKQATFRWRDQDPEEVNEATRPRLQKRETAANR